MKGEQLELPLKIDKPGGIIIFMTAHEPFEFSIYAAKDNKAQHIVTQILSPNMGDANWEGLIQHVNFVLRDSEELLKRLTA